MLCNVVRHAINRAPGDAWTPNEAGETHTQQERAIAIVTAGGCYEAVRHVMMCSMCQHSRVKLVVMERYAAVHFLGRVDVGARSSLERQSPPTSVTPADRPINSHDNLQIVSISESSTTYTTLCIAPRPIENGRIHSSFIISLQGAGGSIKQLHLRSALRHI